MENTTNSAARDRTTETTELEFAQALAKEIARLKAEGYSKAYISERSFEIEDRIRQRLV